MPVAVLIVVAVAALALLFVWLIGPRAVARVIAAVLLLLILLFCIYGFMATFEPLDRSVQLTFRVVYAVLGTSCLAGVVWLLRPRRSS